MKLNAVKDPKILLKKYLFFFGTIFLFSFFWPCYRDIYNLSFPTRVETCAPCIGSTSLTIGLPGKALKKALKSNQRKLVYKENS